MVDSVIDKTLPEHCKWFCAVNDRFYYLSQKAALTSERFICHTFDACVIRHEFRT
jgi:hypothetical protein